MADAAPLIHTVTAFNTAVESENKIHDDAVARKLGFGGGLVPGVDVYAYMTHLPVALWGEAWLARGRIACRLKKPVYDGKVARCHGEVVDGTLQMSVESDGELCATGSASLPDAAAIVDATRYRAVPVAAARPPADRASLVPGRWLGIKPLTVDRAFAAEYLRDVRETAPLYAERGLVHPGTLLRLCNWALRENVVLGPWIHVGSEIENLALAHVGQTLTVRARIDDVHEHKGHDFVVLDALAFADATPVARVRHTAIFRPRQLAA